MGRSLIGLALAACVAAAALAATSVALFGAAPAGATVRLAGENGQLDNTEEARGYLPAVHRALPTPTPTATPPAPAWLQQINQFREEGHLPPVTENEAWSHGAWLHSRYMVMEDDVSHREDPASPWYTVEGDLAGRNGNIAVSTSALSPDLFALELWMTGPFHAVAILDPQLQETAFGAFREEAGYWRMGATLDVYRGLGVLPPGTTFPILFPADGGTTWLRDHRYFEWPDPLASCPGYSRPAGLPVIIQLGAGDVTPAVTDHAFFEGETPLEHCVFDETTYTHPTDGTQQNSGRRVLDSRDAVVLVPRYPLLEAHTYTASITANGSTYRWHFTVGPRPAVPFSAPADAEAR